jgi:molybdenum cofactor synthesis domain-containing protein
VIRVALLTISDGVFAGVREDTAGQTARDWVSRLGWTLTTHDVVPDEAATITARVAGWAAGRAADLILTLGGTGFGPRDVTPEATAPVIERAAPGIAEALRAAGRRSTPFAVLSRGLAGIRGDSLIVNLPGSEKAVQEGLEVLEVVVPHAVELLGGRTEHS